MGVVNDPVEDGVGESGGTADQVMPAIDRDLAGNQGGATAVAVLYDFQHVMTLLRPERLEPPIIEDKEFDAAEGAHQTRVSPVAAGEREIAEHPGDALIEHRAMSRQALWPSAQASQLLPTPAGPSMIRFCASSMSSARGNQCLEQCNSVEDPRRGSSVVDVLDRGACAAAGHNAASPAIAARNDRWLLDRAAGQAIRHARDRHALRIGLQLGEGASAMPASPSWCIWSRVGWVSTIKASSW